MIKRNYGSICCPGGRELEVTSRHSEWLDWATKSLYASPKFEEWLKLSLSSFVDDPAETAFQEGYEAALREVLAQWRTYQESAQ
jgi:hypothetical protein